MKISTELQVIETNISNSHRFTFKTSPKLFDILSNSLYSDKFGSMVRELSSNAYDSHIEAGIPEKQFEIELPSGDLLELSENIIFRDFGVGLSEEDIYRIYTCYGESTKTHSDDLIGAFGIGAKSPLCYTKSFTIISTFNFVKSSYLIFIDAEGFPSITKLFEEKSDISSGFEVIVPIKKSDIQNFEEAIFSQTKRFKPQPKIINGSTDLIEKMKKVDINVEPIFQNNNWKIYSKESNQNQSLIAYSGNIGYFVDLSKLNSTIKSFVETFFLLEVNFNIGELDLNASREGLQYTEKTLNSLNLELTKVILDFFSMLEKEFSSNIPYTIKRLIKVKSNYLYNSNIKDVLKRLEKVAEICNSVISKDIFKYNGTDIFSCKDDVKITFISKQTYGYFKKIADVNSFRRDDKSIRNFLDNMERQNVIYIDKQINKTNIIPLEKSISLLFSRNPISITKESIKEDWFPEIESNYLLVVSPRKTLKTMSDTTRFGNIVDTISNSVCAERVIEIEKIKNTCKQNFDLEENTIYGKVFYNDVDLKVNIKRSKYFNPIKVATKSGDEIMWLLDKEYSFYIGKELYELDDFYYQTLRLNLDKVIFLNLPEYKKLCKIGFKDVIDDNNIVNSFNKELQNLNSTILEKIKEYEYSKNCNLDEHYNNKFCVDGNDFKGYEIKRVLTCLSSLHLENNKLLKLVKTWHRISKKDQEFKYTNVILGNFKFPSIKNISDFLVKNGRSLDKNTDLLDEICTELSKCPILMLLMNNHSMNEIEKKILRKFFEENYS